jgi:hypothetical protein
MSHDGATTRTASAANRDGRSQERWAGRLTPYVGHGPKLALLSCPSRCRLLL